jgi:hypothetical protein
MTKFLSFCSGWHKVPVFILYLLKRESLGKKKAEPIIEGSTPMKNSCCLPGDQ